MDITFIFLSKVYQIEPNGTPKINPNIVSTISQQRLLLKNRGNDDNRLVTHISEARSNKNLSINEVCRLTGLSYNIYIKYERNEVEEQYKNLNTLRKISAVLDLDLFNDYLCFKASSKENVCSYMSTHKFSIRKFAKLCNVSNTTVKNWRNGTCCPSYDKWEKFFKR